MVEKNADPETTLLAYLRRKCILTLEGEGAMGTHSLGLMSLSSDGWEAVKCGGQSPRVLLWAPAL